MTNFLWAAQLSGPDVLHAVMSCHGDGQKHNRVFNFLATMAENVRIVQIKSKRDNSNLRWGKAPNVNQAS